MTLFFIAVEFLFLDAQLVAALQVVVYAGAIMVLFLFVIMLLNLQEEPQAHGASRACARPRCCSARCSCSRRSTSSSSPASGAGTGMAGAVPATFGSTELLAETLVHALPLCVRDHLGVAAGGDHRRRGAGQEDADMTAVPINWYLILGAVLFTIGVIGVLVRRNVIVIFMSIELMLNAVNLVFVALSRQLHVDGRPGRRLLRHDRRGGRGRRRPGDHHLRVPQPRDRERGRAEPAALVNRCTLPPRRTVSYLWLIPALPALGVLFNIFLGPRARARAPSVWSRRASSAPRSSSAATRSCSCSASPHGGALAQNVYPWIHAGTLQVDVAFRIDALSAVMVLIVSGVGFLIHVYSVGYMADDRASCATSRTSTCSPSRC